jgi:hypothetical protein
MMIVLLITWTLLFIVGTRLIYDEPAIVKAVGIFTCVFSAFQVYDTIRIYITRKP